MFYYFRICEQIRGYSVKKLFIYVVDDSPVMNRLACKTVTDWIMKSGLEDVVKLISVAGGEGAIAKFRKIDEINKSSETGFIVIMDYHMPMLTGLDTAKEISKIVNQDKSFEANLVMLGFSTSYSEFLQPKLENLENEIVREEIKKIFNGFLSKDPIQTSDWEETLNSIVSKMDLKIPAIKDGVITKKDNRTRVF